MQPTNYFGTFSEFDDLFERMSRELGRGRTGPRGGSFAVDVAHHDDEVIVTADVPGFESEDFDVAVDGDLLTLHADADVADEDAGDDYVRRERRHRTIHRTISLPVAVDGEDASATYRNGVLTVSLPTVTDADSHRIAVE